MFFVIWGLIHIVAGVVDHQFAFIHLPFGALLIGAAIYGAK